MSRAPSRLRPANDADGALLGNRLRHARGRHRRPSLGHRRLSAAGYHGGGAVSTEKRPLTAFDGPDDPDPEPEPNVVGSRATDGKSDPTRCLGCGGHVTEQFRRVMGDNDDRVHACPSCADKFGSGRVFAGLEEMTDGFPEIGGGVR